MILVVDDLRTFPFEATHCRDSLSAITLLVALHSGMFPANPAGLDELWLDHDLGGDDTTMPVVDLLDEWAFHGDPLPIGNVYVHTSNPPGALKIIKALHLTYNVRRVDAAACGAVVD